MHSFARALNTEQKKIKKISKFLQIHVRHENEYTIDEESAYEFKLQHTLHG